MNSAAMDRSEPILILGGGLIGLAIAHGLGRRGHAVTVLSRRRNEAAGFVAAGMLAPMRKALAVINCCWGKPAWPPIQAG